MAQVPIKVFPEVDYSDEELRYRDNLLEELKSAQEARDANHDEFDGMTYLEYYESNLKAGNSYIEPRKNQADVRIVTGTTLEKVNTLVSALLNYNFEANIIAYDKEFKEVMELGESMESLIYKSRQMENPDYEVKRDLYYREGCNAGDAFIEELLYETEEMDKELTGKDWNDAINMKKNWEEKKKGRITREIRSNLISGPNFYSGNLKDFFIESQPYVFTREVKTYAECDMLYKNWTRWENVPDVIEKFSNTTGQDVRYHDWSLYTVKKGWVEVIKYYNKPKNEYMILLNGVMMLPIEFPLSAISPSGDYPISKFTPEPISRYFFYGKSIPAKMKVDQAILDEWYRTSIRKNRKNADPSYANNTGKHFSGKLFNPGTVIDSIDPTKLQPIGNNDGVTQADLAYMQFIKSTINEKSVSPVFQGIGDDKGQTATAIIESKKQSLQKLGSVVVGVTNFEKRMCWLRIYSILANWTKAEDTKVDKFKSGIKEVYKKIEVQDVLDDGMEGTKVFEFTDKMMKPNQLMAKEKLLTMRGAGKRYKIIQLNRKELVNCKLYWEIVINPTDKSADSLDRAQFMESLSMSKQLFPNTMQNEYWQEQFAIKNKLDPEKAFLTAEQSKQKQMEMMKMQLGGQAPQRASNGGPSVPQRVPQRAQPGRVNRQVAGGAQGVGVNKFAAQKPSVNQLTTR